MKILKYKYLFEPTHLPEKGWFQGCYKCESITSKTISYRNVNTYSTTYKFIVFVCKPCQRILKNNTEKKILFHNKCDSYISEELYSC